MSEFELDELANRARFEEQLEKAKARFAELKESVGIKAAA